MKKKIMTITPRELPTRSNKRKKIFLSKDWYKLANKCNFKILPLLNSNHKSLQFLNQKKLKDPIFQAVDQLRKI